MQKHCFLQRGVWRKMIFYNCVLMGKIKINIKRKTQDPDVVEFTGEPRVTIEKLRQLINLHITTNNLQTSEKLFVEVDQKLAKLTGLEKDSIHRLNEIHNTALAKI